MKGHGMSEARSVLGVICSFYDSFFEAEKKIADYIMEHKAQAVDMTVGELARASGTSDATVSRFCRRCGFKGFQSLKLALAREVLREEQDSRKVTNDIDRENLSQSLNNILANKVAELTETVRMMDIHSLEEILKSWKRPVWFSWLQWEIRSLWLWTALLSLISWGFRLWPETSGKRRQLIPLIWGRRMWCSLFPIPVFPGG